MTSAPSRPAVQYRESRPSRSGTTRGETESLTVQYGAAVCSSWSAWPAPYESAGGMVK